MGRPLRELAALVGGRIDGDEALVIEGLAGLEEARAGELSFFSSPRFKAALNATAAGAVLVGPDAPARTKATYVVVDNPLLAFAQVSASWNPGRAVKPGCESGARVDSASRVHATATVMAGATIEAFASVGARAVLYPGAFVGAHARIGEDTVLYPNAVVGERCVVGARCILHANCVVGADGFGFVFDPSLPGHRKIPQVGIARLEDDVELGACACVDRATLHETVVGQGSKIDNLVQVAHNVHIGPHSVLCAQSGVSGSSRLGTGVFMQGQAGVAGHVHVGDLARIGAQAGVAQDVGDGAHVLGTPAIEQGTFLRAVLSFARLPEMLRDVRNLKRRLETLEKKTP